MAGVAGVPSLSDVVRVIMRYPVGRWAAVRAVAVGRLALVIRGWLFLLRA